MKKGDKTMEQDWEDSFPFLQKQGLEAPFLMALCHARSLRHLRAMLSEWLPPHWRLSRDEVVAMELHWATWYEENRATASGGHDSVVRSAMSRLTRGSPGLTEHYLDKMREAFGVDEERWTEAIRGQKTEGATDLIRVGLQLFGRSCGFTIYLRPTSSGTTKAWACIGFWGNPSDLVTKSFTHSVLGLPHPAHAGRYFNGVNLTYELDIESLKKTADLARVSDSYQERMKLEREAVRQLNDSGVPVILT